MISGKLLEALRADVDDIFPAYSSIAKATVIAAMLQNDAMCEVAAALKNFPEQTGHEMVLALKHMGWDSAVPEIATALSALADKED